MAQAIYLRGKVIATSKTPIKNCTAFLIGIDGIDEFNPIELVWSTTSQTTIDIHPGIDRYFDILNIDELNQRITLTTKRYPLTLVDIQDLRSFVLRIRVTEDNTTPAKLAIQIQLGDKWDEIRARKAH
ncbi:MAG TPA: hypothetical protein V6C99_08570 [Oculatellaceae cyanobacterium]|jgi:hypothetical protein